MCRTTLRSATDFPPFHARSLIKEFERPVVPPAAIGPNQRATAAPFVNVFPKQKLIEGRLAERDLDSKRFERVSIDCRPDIVLEPVGLDFRLIDDGFFISSGVRFEEVLEPMKLLPDRIVVAIEEGLDPPVREASIIQKRRK